MASRSDVAHAAGVSVRTVSNVVNGFPHISPETRERVLRAIEDLGYRPSELARSLKVGRSGLIGLMLPELDTPYFAELTRAFVEGGAERGFTVVVDQTDGQYPREEAFIQRAAHGALFDAMILNPLASHADTLRSLTGVPLVFLGEDDFPGFDRVMIDNYQAAIDAVSHLIQTGRTRIAAIGAERTPHGSSALRLSGYRSAIVEGGLDIDDRLIEYVESFTRAEGAAAMRRILDRGETPDAVFCFSDPLALGAARVLHERGISIPERIALMGWDDIEDGRFAFPTLSTVSPDKLWIARTALDRIVQRLSGVPLKPETLAGPYHVVVRESSASS